MELVNNVFLVIGGIVGIFSFIMFYSVLGYLLFMKARDGVLFIVDWISKNVKVGSMIDAIISK